MVKTQTNQTTIDQVLRKLWDSYKSPSTKRGAEGYRGLTIRAGYQNTVYIPKRVAEELKLSKFEFCTFKYAVKNGVLSVMINFTKTRESGSLSLIKLCSGQIMIAGNALYSAMDKTDNISCKFNNQNLKLDLAEYAGSMAKFDIKIPTR